MSAKIYTENIDTLAFRNWLWEEIIFEQCKSFIIRIDTNWLAEQSIRIFTRKFNLLFKPQLNIEHIRTFKKKSDFHFKIDYPQSANTKGWSIGVLMGSSYNPISINNLIEKLQRTGKDYELFIYSETEPENTKALWIPSKTNSYVDFNINEIKELIYDKSSFSNVLILHERIIIENFLCLNDSYLFGTPNILNSQNKEYLSLAYLENYNILDGTVSRINYSCERREFVSINSKHFVPYIDGGCLLLNKTLFRNNPFSYCSLYWGECEDVELSALIFNHFGSIKIIKSLGNFYSKSDKTQKHQYHFLISLILFLYAKFKG